MNRRLNVTESVLTHIRWGDWNRVQTSTTYSVNIVTYIDVTIV